MSTNDLEARAQVAERACAELRQQLQRMEHRALRSEARFEALRLAAQEHLAAREASDPARERRSRISLVAFLSEEAS